MLLERVSKMLWKGFSMNPNSWMENPALSGIDPAKLQLLTSLAGQAQGKSQNELLPFLMSAASGQLSFAPTEIDTIIRVLKIGKSPQEFLISYRMTKAAELLKLTSLSIADIGNAVGYPNQLHFSRAFKNTYGTSPRSWRTENKLEPDI